MARSRTPGPIGFPENSQAIDPGTLARMLSPLPGPIGLGINPPVLMAPKAAVPRQLGITVHQESEISAQEWVKKINDSNYVPDYFKEQIKSKGSVIYVTNPKRFKYPKNIIPIEWLDDWLSVFVVEQWEMTTGRLDMSVKKGDAAGPSIKIVDNPDISSGETIDPVMKLFAMTVTTRSAESISIDRGHTIADGVTLKSGRKLIVVANRIALSLGGKIKMFKFEDPELLETWFHETACHAGRITQRKHDEHGDPEVNRAAIEIETRFPKAMTVPKVFAEIQDFLKSRPGN